MKITPCIIIKHFTTGVTSSQFFYWVGEGGSTVKHHMSTYESEDPEFVQQFFNSLYVDNMLGGDENVPMHLSFIVWQKKE